MQQSAFEIEVDVDNLETAFKSVLTYSPGLLRKLYVAADKSFPITVKIARVRLAIPPKNGTGYVLRTKLESTTPATRPCRRRTSSRARCTNGASTRTTCCCRARPRRRTTTRRVPWSRPWRRIPRHARLRRLCLLGLVRDHQAARPAARVLPRGGRDGGGAGHDRHRAALWRPPPRDRAQEEKDYSDEHAPNADPMAKKQRVRGAAANSAAAAAANSAAAAQRSSSPTTCPRRPRRPVCCPRGPSCPTSSRASPPARPLSAAAAAVPLPFRKRSHSACPRPRASLAWTTTRSSCKCGGEPRTTFC